MKLSGNVVKGYVYFRNHLEIEYEIRRNGSIAITRHGKLNSLDTEKIFTMIENHIKARLNEVHNTNIRTNYSAGEYYLRRNQSLKLGKKAQKAIDDGVFSGSFLKQMAAWNLGLVHPDKK